MPQSITQLEAVDPAEFRRHHAKASRPAVVRDAFSYWPHASKWRIEKIAERFADRSVPAYETGEEVNLADQLNRIVQSSSDEPEPYIRNLNVITELPELLPDLSPAIPLSTPNRICSPLLPGRLFPRDGHLLELFVGGPGSGFPYVHYDDPVMHTWSLLLQGSKEWTLFAPSDGAYLYPKKDFHYHSRIADVDDVDLERFPLFEKATPVKHVQKPGELLFVPAGWWHTAKNLQPSLTIAWDQLNRDNWKAYCDYVRFQINSYAPSWRAAMVYLYLRCMGPILTGYESLFDQEEKEPFWLAQARPG